VHHIGGDVDAYGLGDGRLECLFWYRSAWISLILLAEYDEEWIGRRIRDTYTRYHSCTTTIVQDPHTLLFFVSVKPFLFGFGDVKEVNANPGKTRTDCRNELLCGLFILIGMR
jgi:hypothetical protein